MTKKTEVTSRAVQLVAAMQKGDRLSLARIISKIENRDSDLDELMKELFPRTGRAQVWGVTGPPGAGKSTMLDQMTRKLRKQGLKVAIVAVDPSSPFSGGAILGDRIRMQDHSGDPGVFVRSIGTRGRHGGLSHSTKEVVLALDSAGFDVILVETAGVGQTELEILRLAQTILVILVPESGDSIQVMKAGLMEIADVFAVNKSDRPQADQLVRSILNMIGLGDSGSKWKIPVLKTEAVNDRGIDELLLALQGHQTHLSESGEREERAKEFLQNEVTDILAEKLSQDLEATFAGPEGEKILKDLIAKKIDPYRAASKISNIKT